MKKHIIFVMGKYTPEYSANVNCIENIIQELKQRNCKISIICGSNEKTGFDILDNISVHRIKFIDYSSKLIACKSKKRKYYLQICHFLKSVILLFTYPNVNPLFSYKLYKQLIAIQKNEGVDCVIGVFQPYFAINTALKFKKNFKNIPVIGYYLDVIQGANKPLGVPLWIFKNLCIITQKKDFIQFDKLFLPECSNVYYEVDYFKLIRDKIVYLNFPTLLKKNYVGENVSSSMNLVYAGTTNSIYRNPIRAIKIFTILKKTNSNLVFNLYGSSDIVAELKQLEKKSEGAFFYHGVVNKNDADFALQKADFCISFGNDIQGMVPSKVFELISLGKSIIHFTPGNTDSSLNYFIKYPKANIIYYQKSDSEIILELNEVLHKSKKHIDYNTIEELFYSATPKVVSDKIIESTEIENSINNLNSD